MRAGGSYCGVSSVTAGVKGVRLGLLTGHGGNEFPILNQRMRLEKRATGIPATKPTPSIVVIFSPLEGLVRTTSSPRVVARMLALLSMAIAPPVNIGAMTLPTSNVVLRGCFAAILSVVLGVATTIIACSQLEEGRINFLGFFVIDKRAPGAALIDKDMHTSRASDSSETPTYCLATSGSASGLLNTGATWSPCLMLFRSF